MDAITLLRKDHKDVEALFSRIEKHRSGTSTKDLVAPVIRELSTHAAIEETVFYPAIREVSPDLREYVLESLEEHEIVKWELSALQGMGPDDERFDAKVAVLTENVRQHVYEEEHALFPVVHQVFSRRQLNELGARLEQAKRTAPTRPHPLARNHPPANIVVGAMTGLVDRVIGSGAQVATRATHAIHQDRHPQNGRTVGSSSRR